MTFLLVPLAVVWAIGAAMGTAARQRYVMMLVVFVAWIALQFALPEGNPARVDAEYMAQSIVGVGVIAFGVWLYRLWFGRIKARVAVVDPTPVGGFSGGELDRYARHVIMREIGGQGQKALRDAKVLVVGAGGLGSPALQYLAAAGVGTIGVIDDDVVEATNLQRQVIHNDAMIGEPKVKSAAQAIAAQNPYVSVRPYHRRLTEDIAPELIADYDLVLDGCDDFETRYLVNAVCAADGVPLVAAALTQWEGQISVYDPARNAPCYACVFPNAPAAGLAATCAEAGVLGPLPGVVGAMMAAEAVKILTGAGEPLRGRMMIYDALYAEVRVIGAKRRADCAVCGGLHPLSG